MEKPCQKLLSMMEVLEHLMKSADGEGAHHAQAAPGEAAVGRKSVEDNAKETRKEVKILKLSTF